MDEKEKKIISLLIEGYSQQEIIQYFRDSKEFKLKSLSSIEVKIKKLKKLYGVKTLYQLGAAVEKQGIL